MNRRQFLQSALTVAKKEITSTPQQLAKIPKNTLTNVREYDKLAKTVKNKGNTSLTRSSFLEKAKKKIGTILMKNPKETAYRTKQGAAMVTKGAKLATSSAEDIALQADSRKLNKLQKFLGNFSYFNY